MIKLWRGWREHKLLSVASGRFEVVLEAGRRNRWQIDRVDAAGNMLKIHHRIFALSLIHI